MVQELGRIVLHALAPDKPTVRASFNTPTQSVPVEIVDPAALNKPSATNVGPPRVRENRIDLATAAESRSQSKRSKPASTAASNERFASIRSNRKSTQSWDFKQLGGEFRGDQALQEERERDRAEGPQHFGEYEHDRFGDVKVCAAGERIEAAEPEPVALGWEVPVAAGPLSGVCHPGGIADRKDVTIFGDCAQIGKRDPKGVQSSDMCVCQCDFGSELSSSAT